MAAETLSKSSITKEVVRLGKYLNEITIIKDPAGKIVHRAIKPLMTEFYFRDMVQVIVGATILAIPVAFTEETWVLGGELPWLNVIMLVVISLTFISLFVYHNYYNGSFKSNYLSFFQRVFSTYFISLLVVALLLTIIERASWFTFWDIALKRVFIVSLPASMSASIADVVK